MAIEQAEACELVGTAVPQKAPLGSWRSRISTVMAAGSRIALLEPSITSLGTYWLEARPAEGGRTVLVTRNPDREINEVLPAEFDCRSRVHEYGGGSYILRDASVFFVNLADQRIYRQDPGEKPWPLTPKPLSRASLRYADLSASPDGRWLFCVRECHDGGRVVNDLVAVPTDGCRIPQVVTSGRDFYSFPRVSPDGRRLAWTAWDHPQMPWDGTELWLANLCAGGEVVDARLVAGGPQESIFQPDFSPEGVLHFVSDRTGWWNLYRMRHGGVEPIAPLEAEVGVPQWEFGLSTYCFLPDGRIACIVGQGALQQLALLSPDSNAVDDLGLPYSSFDQPCLHNDGYRLVFVAASPTHPESVVSYDCRTDTLETLQSSFSTLLTPDCISVPRAIEFRTDGGVTAHALHYPPANPEFTGMPGEKPPALVVTHGGPTGQASTALSLGVQFWTSRGFAVIDVNYGGSSGYGRAYRARLRGRWGEVDVADCINACLHLATEVDLDRLAIRGASAGGYTTLAALTFHDVFSAGASYFGVADLETLAQETHKFEAHYLSSLIGPYPEAASLYKARSPIHALERICCPIIIFQGLDDAVVPPSQAVAMTRGMDAAGIPFAYLAFEGEEHGFRDAETIHRALEAELSFYSRIFGFDLSESVEPVEIKNWTSPDRT